MDVFADCAFRHPAKFAPVAILKCRCLQVIWLNPLLQVLSHNLSGSSSGTSDSAAAMADAHDDIDSPLELRPLRPWEEAKARSVENNVLNRLVLEFIGVTAVGDVRVEHLGLRTCSILIAAGIETYFLEAEIDRLSEVDARTELQDVYLDELRRYRRILQTDMPPSDMEHWKRNQRAVLDVAWRFLKIEDVERDERECALRLLPMSGFLSDVGQ